jgi:hypothetical protein
MVLIDHNRHTAIVLSHGPVWVTCVRMQDGLLTTGRLSRDQMSTEGWRELDYPTDKAIRQYLRHPGGLSEAAKRELETLLFFGD